MKSQLEAAEKRLHELETAYAGTEYEEIMRDIQWAEARLSLLHKE